MPNEKPHPAAAGPVIGADRPTHGSRPEAEIAGSDEPTPTVVARRGAVEETAGALTGAYEPRYLQALRQDWPA